MIENKIIGTKEVLAFFKKKGIIYLNRTKNQWLPLEKIKLKTSSYFKENINEFVDLDKRYGSLIDKAHLAPIYIKKIDNKVGYGVFAHVEIKKDDFIGEYAGVIDIADKDTEVFDDGSYETDFSWNYPDDLPHIELEINGRLEGNELRFVNHNENNNLLVEHTIHKGSWLIFFVAKRDIKKDEQLFVSYGEEYWSGGFRTIQDLNEKKG